MSEKPWNTAFAYLPRHVGYDQDSNPVTVWWKYYEWREDYYNRGHRLVEYRPCPPVTATKTLVYDFPPYYGDD
jgi:hypothetical protein